MRATTDQPTTDQPARDQPQGSARRGPERPERLAGYAVLLTTYSTVFGVGLVAAERRHGAGRGHPPPSWSDVALVGASTFKLARLVTRQPVTTPLRAPFTRDAGPSEEGERRVRPRGTGLRRSVGELLSCPFCVDVWLASMATLGLRLAPRTTRTVLAAFASVAVADLLQFVHAELQQRAAS